MTRGVRNGYGAAGSYGEPEVLPPVRGPVFEPPPPPPPPLPPVSAPRRRSSRGWAAAPATYTLLGINCAVYLAMCLAGVSPFSPTPRALLMWGADYGGFVLALDQWWRLGTAMFVHIGLLHLLANMWCLWNLGLLGEPLLGAAGLFGAYLLTGFAGNLLSVATHPGLNGGDAIIGAGASGAIFGLAGVLIVLLGSAYLPLPPRDRKALRKDVIWFAVLNFILAIGVNSSHMALRIDNSAHLGGFLCGLLLAVPMVPRIGAPAALFRRRRFWALGAGALSMLLLCVGVRAFYLGGGGR